MSTSVGERLERGEVVFYPVCPFPVVNGDDRPFLLAQSLGGRAHKNISYDPRTGKVSGFRRQHAGQAEQLRDVLAAFSRDVTAWAKTEMPAYAQGWRLDMVSFRPEEEATRKVRHNARNDLLHVDAFPSRPTNGWRILRFFVNLNPTEPRIWVTSDPFGRLLERFGTQAGLPGSASTWPGLLSLFGVRRRSDYDAFMLRFHDFLKSNEAFQERGPKQFWKFPPGSAWLAMTDTCSHCVLRGRYALEHSYFVAPQTLTLPDESPPALLARVCGRPVLARVA